MPIDPDGIKRASPERWVLVDIDNHGVHHPFDTKEEGEKMLAQFNESNQRRFGDKAPELRLVPASQATPRYGGGPSNWRFQPINNRPRR